MQLRYSILGLLCWFLAACGTVAEAPLQLTPAPTPTPAAEEAPYIYYYSRLHNAFIVERADGTDSFVLGEGVMPEDYGYVTDLQWSPTGRYFAWRGWNSWRYSEIYQPFIVRGDNYRVSLPVELYNYNNIHRYFLHWSPVADIVIIQMDYYDDVLEEYVTLIVIYDVENERQVIRREFRNTRYRLESMWSRNGQAIIVRQTRDELPDRQWQIDLDGTTTYIGYKHVETYESSMMDYNLARTTLFQAIHL